MSVGHCATDLQCHTRWRSLSNGPAPQELHAGRHLSKFNSNHHQPLWKCLRRNLCKNERSSCVPIFVIIKPYPYCWHINNNSSSRRSAMVSLCFFTTRPSTAGTSSPDLLLALSLLAFCHSMPWALAQWPPSKRWTLLHQGQQKPPFWCSLACMLGSISSAWVLVLLLCLGPPAWCKSQYR